MPWRGSTAGALLLLSACAKASPQWTVELSTDAPLPTFGDRLLVEVLDDTGAPACSGCRHDLGLGPDTGWPVSFGVLPPASGGTLHVRARLYRADHVGPDGLPLADGDGVVDALGALPPPNGDTRVSLALPGECFERPSSVTGRTSCGGPEGVLPAASAQNTLSPGTWPPISPARCPSALPAGMRCVPGGVFLCGNVHTPPVDAIYDAGAATAAVPERAVRLDSFLLDVDEMTVGDLRQLVQGGQVAFATDAEPNASGGAVAIREPGNPDAPSSDNVDPACTWRGAQDAAHDALPLNCLPWSSANALCRARGGRLPTEAEWEYAAGNAQRETTYPWGESPDLQDLCSHAFVGRGRAGGAGPPENAVCLEDDAGVAPGPTPRGTETRDVTDVGIRNMGGNLQEFVGDNFEAYSEACWTAGGPLLQNPLCDAGGAAAPRSVRGGGWQASPILAVVSERNLVPPAYPGDAFTGLRCVVDLN